LKAPDVLSGTPASRSRGSWALPEGLPSMTEGALRAMYTLALVVSISSWFIAIRAPLWLDETVSFFVIKGSFAQIISRQGWPGVPAYPYLLWLWAKAVGTGEIALRISSVVAMLGAVYLLYRSARELFDWDVAAIAAVVFCLHPIINSESIDVRPYAFAALAITWSIFVLVRLRHNNSNWLAAVFGVSTACIIYFQFLFAVILPALVICFFAIKAGGSKTRWRQFGVALIAFAVAFLPVVPGAQFMFHTSSVHVFDLAPSFWELRGTLAEKRPVLILAGTILLAGVTRRFDLRSLEGRKILFCGSLGLIPLLILYGVSVGTSTHIFVPRYRVVAIPGIALCWAYVVSGIESRLLRLVFCIALVAVTAYHSFTSPSSRIHNYTWKYALEAAEKNASPDNAPVVICSDLPESDHMQMPIGSAAKDNALFAPLSYYQLSVPVVPLPRALNGEAVQAGSQFLQEAASRRERFLALAFEPSYPTLDWLARKAEGTHRAHELGMFDRVKVVEFIPRSPVGRMQ
jgi:Dolichyl-phosphate-mannose-protein mannosyltransferase